MTLLLGWIVIFLHSVIPHTHIHEYYHELKSFAHLIGHTQYCTEDHQAFEAKETGTENICHLSDNLFHKLAFVEHFIYANDRISIISIEDSTTNLFFDYNQIIPDHYIFFNSLRAPPSAA